METKLFTPNSDELRYKIVIDVYHNCSQFSVSDVKSGIILNYHDIVGCLEANKIMLINAQREVNKEHFNNKKTKTNARRTKGDKPKSK